MSEELFVKLMLGFISILSALISAYVIPYLRSKATSAQLENFSLFIEKAVRCAEQIFSPEEWKEKKIFVVDRAQEFLQTNTGLNLTDEQIDTIIEGIVNEVKRW